MTRLLISLLATLTLVACADSDPTSSTTPSTLPADPKTQSLNALMDNIASTTGAVGFGIYVKRQGLAPFEATRGVANRDTNEKLRSDHLFRIASQSKPYLAALVVKLDREGKLSLYDKLTAHLPPELTSLIPNADTITLFDMLTMWSGISDYRDATFTAEVLQGDPSVVRDEYRDLVAGLKRNPTPCAAPEIALADVTPDIAECLYSNSNYVLLGYVVDSVLYGVSPAEGVRPQHHSKAFYQDFFLPLQLTSTFYEKHLLEGQSFDGRLAHAYFPFPDDQGQTSLIDVTGWDDGYGYANGGLVSTMADLSSFRAAVLDPSQTFPMQTLEDKQSFLSLYTKQNGLGVAPAGYLDGAYWTFSGDISGYTSWAENDVASGVSIVFVSNDHSLDSAKVDIVNAVKAILAEK
ncbi:MAG: serine hydrolase [Polyangiaceae bacterium]